MCRGVLLTWVVCQMDSMRPPVPTALAFHQRSAMPFYYSEHGAKPPIWSVSMSEILFQDKRGFFHPATEIRRRRLLYLRNTRAWPRTVRTLADDYVAAFGSKSMEPVRRS